MRSGNHDNVFPELGELQRRPGLTGAPAPAACVSEGEET